MSNPSLAASDLARLAGRTVAQVEAALASSTEPHLMYRELTATEAQFVAAEVDTAITTHDLRVVGGNDPTVWERGWGELADALVERDITLDALRPQYFHGEPVCRLEHRYVRGLTPGFEYDAGLALRRIIFDEFLHGFGRVVEFGCGTGLNLLLLAQQFPGVALIGTDWATASQRLLTTMAAKLGAAISGRQFNMLTPTPWPDGPFGDATAVLTVHAMEQLGSNWRPFADFLYAQRPALCVHVEPLFELYDPSAAFDRLAIRYHQKRGYLRGFLPYLRECAARGKAIVLAERRIAFGGLYHEAYSVMVWRPAPQ